MPTFIEWIGVSTPLKNTPLFLAKTPSNLQTVQAPPPPLTPPALGNLVLS